MNKLYHLITFNICDTPRPWGIYFQDSATPQMEGLVELHDNIMFYLVIILFGVAWIMLSIIRNYSNKRSPISHKYLNHGTTIELIWTITPALILILIAFPSFKRAPRETTSENNKYIGAGDNFGYLPPNNAYIKPNKILYGIAVVESPECAGLPRHKLGISGGNMTRFTNSIYSLIGYRRPTSPPGGLVPSGPVPAPLRKYFFKKKRF